MQNALVTADTALAIRTLDGDAEPRVLDTDLAEALGFYRAVNIRNLVKRHRAALEQFGTLFTAERVIRGGLATEFYLNHEQAIHIVHRSETPNATALSIQITKKFMAYERGEIVAQPVEKEPAPAALPATYRDALLALVAQIDATEAAEERVATLEQTVNYITVDAYRALMGVNWPQGKKVKLGQYAARITRSRGEAPGKEGRVFTDKYGVEHHTTVGVYTREILDEALYELEASVR